MASLNDMVLQLSTNDTKKKLSIGQDIIDYLGHPDNSVECDDLGSFIDTLVPFIQSSNFKVSQNGLDIAGLLIEKMGHTFRPYVNSVMPAAVDRLGDTRETVREKAGFLLSKLLEEDVLEPQVLFEKNVPAFSHKNGKVREEMLILLQNTLNVYGAQSLTVTRFLPAMVCLLSDPTASVRDAAFNTLVEIYTHFGERVRIDLQRKHQVPTAKLPLLMSKFDMARANGEMKATATLGMGTTEGNSRGDDETDRQSVKSATSSKSRSSSVPAGRRQIFAAPKPPAASGGGPTAVEAGNSARGSVMSNIRRNPSMRVGSGAGGQAGAVDEEAFIQAFEEVKKVSIFNARSLTDELSKIRETLTKTSNDWKVRIDALQMMRSLLVAGADQFDEMTQALKTLEVPFQSSVKDLRSQVVREACITIGYMSQQLRHRVDRFLEALIQNIINLIPNSAKVMSTSGIVCMRFIIQNTYSARFIPILTSNISAGKSRDIRKHCCEFLQQLLHTWPTHALEKHKDILQESIKKGISDADPDARVFARKAYWGFADHFKDQADALLNSLEHNHRRILQSSGASGEMSNSSSSNSLNTAGRVSGLSSATAAGAPGQATSSGSVYSARSRQASVTSSKENLLDGDGSRKSATLQRKYSGTGIPMYMSPTKVDAPNGIYMSNGSTRQTPPARSNSAIDASAVRRASVRAQYSQRHRMGTIGSAGIAGASLPRPRKISEGKIGGMTPSPLTPNNTNAMRNGGRSRSTVAHSQPGSRSTSPSSISSYATYFSQSGQPTSMGMTPRTGRTSSGIPRSRGASRETSPNRYSGGYGQRRVGTGTRSGITPDRPPKRPDITERILEQSQKAENDLAKALKNSRKNSRVKSQGYDDGDRSDESETSSVCSEKSYPDYGRRSSDFGLRDSRERLWGQPWDPVNQDIGEIIANCASTHWADRKDGLIGLQCYFRDGRMLTGSELRRVTEIFARMFMDAHTKVFTLFLDTLIELVVTHKDDLRDWLHILITRLLNKLGSDLLGSVVQKISRTLDVIKDTFPLPAQLTVLMRFLVDQALTPNTKVKMATTKHVAAVAQSMEEEHLGQRGQLGLLLSDAEEQMALAKIITWTYEPKSAEVRKQSQCALVSLFRLNPTHYGRILGTLPKIYQDNATPLVSAHLMNESTATLTPTDSSESLTTDSADTIPTLKNDISLTLQNKPSTNPDSLMDTTLPTGPSPMKPRLIHSPNSKEGIPVQAKKISLGYRASLDPADDAENLNPEDIHQSLRSTANAIQNYSFDTDVRGEKNSDNAVNKSVNISIQRERTSEKNSSGNIFDSGGKGDSKDLPKSIQDPTDFLVEKLSLLEIDSPKQPNGSELQLHQQDLENVSRGEESRLAMQDIINELHNVKSQDRANERRACMTQLIRMSRDGQMNVIQDSFRTLLRLLLENLMDELGATRALVFGVLTEMLKQEQLISCFQGYTELIILKVLESHRDPEKDVERAAEGCAAAMAGVLPADKVIQVLNPIIKTGDFPVNQAAVKMLSKVAEHESSKEVVTAHLESIMPGLLKAYDNVESSVRKASVFCMVALHQLVGESLQPHLSSLNGSKLKLLNLYIKRAQAQSTPASPRLTTPP